MAPAWDSLSPSPSAPPPHPSPSSLSQTKKNFFSLRLAQGGKGCLRNPKFTSKINKKLPSHQKQQYNKTLRSGTTKKVYFIIFLLSFVCLFV